MWTWDYWRERLQKLKEWWNNAKFEYAIKAIFIFAVIVSFSHTIELYGSVGFDEPVMWMNRLARVDFITLSLFATLAAEAAFAVGLWGLYEAYEKNRKFPAPKEHWHVWTLFGSGLIVVGWSNIGGAVGYDFIVGQPYKGIALAISIPLFVLGSVLVNFKRKSTDQSAIDQAGGDHSITQGSINQSGSNHAINQSTDNQSTDNRSIIIQATSGRSNNQESIKQTESDQSIIHSSNQSIDQSSGEQDNKSIKHSIDQSINQPLTDQSQIDQNEKESIKQSESFVGQSIKQDKKDQSANNRSISIQSEINHVSSNQSADDHSTVDQTAKSNVVKFDQDITARYPVEQALKYYKENGKLPTQRGLAKIAETSQHRAMMAVRWLKEQIEQGKVA